MWDSAFCGAGINIPPVIVEMKNLMKDLNSCIVKNTSAKAAADIALWDLYGQLHKIPVYKLLGGSHNKIVTDITISVNPPEEMARDAINAIKRGYDTLKVKVGIDPTLDVARLNAIRDAIGKDYRIRIDANQAWSPKQAIRLLNQMQDKGLDIELVEQPVKAHDFDGLRYVTKHSDVPVLADESVFSPEDAFKILQMKAADLINIKLMKCGGIYNALKIINLAEVVGVECMIGCMLEAKVSVNAAAVSALFYVHVPPRFTVSIAGSFCQQVKRITRLFNSFIIRFYRLVAILPFRFEGKGMGKREIEEA